LYSGYSQLIHRFIHRAAHVILRWIRALHMRKEHLIQLLGEVDDLALQLNRLEIAFKAMRERLDALEGRHESLSAASRGRLGGRPPKPNGALQAPLVLGTQFPQRQE
jgi:hypothetical protein